MYDEDFSCYKIELEGNEFYLIGLLKNIQIQNEYSGLTACDYIDISNMPIIENINCEEIGLNLLGIGPKNTRLNSINCRVNNLTSIDVSACDKLEELYAEANKITYIDVSNNILLFDFRYCSESITTLDLTKNKNIERLGECENSNITTIRTRTDNKIIATVVAFNISSATSTSGTLVYVPGGDYEEQIVNAAKTKGWTVKQIAG